VRLAFFGTPEVAAATLRALVGAGHEVRVVVTRPDKRRGRGSERSPSPVKVAAGELGLETVYSPEEALGKGAELGVVVAYGRLLKPEVLSQLTVVNVHFSLLPRWRGPAPVERAVLAGDTETGVCVMQLEAGLDTGPLYACRRTAVGPDETATELRGRLGEMGTALLLEMLGSGLPKPVPQVGEPTYAAKVEPSELCLDFAGPAERCLRQVRARRAWTTFRGRRLLVHRARLAHEGVVLSPGQIRGNVVGTADGAIELIVVQPEGKKAMSGEDWARGARPQPGELLGW
jgi:methionyl-tRNA formyltransferase